MAAEIKFWLEIKSVSTSRKNLYLLNWKLKKKAENESLRPDGFNMNGIDWILLSLIVVGFLPLAIILYKRRIVAITLKNGINVEARIYSIYTVHKSSTDIVHYLYSDPRTGKQYKGTMTTKMALYKTGDSLTIYFLPNSPHRSTMKGAWKSWFLLTFGIVIALFILFAAWKIHEAVREGSM